MELGKYNVLKIGRKVDFGVYLDAGDELEILLPAKYLEGNEQVGDEIEVFVYKDSENRLIATTEHPKAIVGEMAYLTVSQVNETGAFLDWGLAKDLLVPFREQRQRMRAGGTYLVYVYVDNASQRIVATAKVEKYIGNTIPPYRRGDKIDCLFYKRTEIGYRVIVDNAYFGILYFDEVHGEIDEERHFKAFVRWVREDGRIDVTLADRIDRRLESIAERILFYLRINHGEMTVTDKSSPDLIELTFSCSKKDFKRTLGHLYKLRKISITPEKVVLLEK